MVLLKYFVERVGEVVALHLVVLVCKVGQRAGAFHRRIFCLNTAYYLYRRTVAVLVVDVDEQMLVAHTQVAVRAAEQAIPNLTLGSSCLRYDMAAVPAKAELVGQRCEADLRSGCVGGATVVLFVLFIFG